MKAFQICIISKSIHPFSGNSHRMDSIKTRELLKKRKAWDSDSKVKGIPTMMKRGDPKMAAAQR